MQPERIALHAAVQADRAKRLSKARESFEDLVAWVEGPAQQLTLFRAEQEVVRRIFSLGLAVMGLWLAFHAPVVVPRSVRCGQGWYAFKDLAGDWVRTRLGVVWAVRPVYERVSGRGPALIAPEDQAIGLCSGRMTLGVHLLAAWLAARMPFDDVVATQRQFGGYAPSKRSVEGIVDELGPDAARWLEVMPPPEGDGDVLVIEVDAKGSPMIGSAEHRKRCRPHRKGPQARADRRQRRRKQARPRRTKGKRSKNARMANVAVIYTLRRLPDGRLDGPLNKRIIAFFGTKRELFVRAKREALLRGYGTKESYFLADGDLDLWDLCAEFFPDATPCVDWYHVCEYLWSAGTARHPEGSPRLVRWVHARKGELLDENVDAVLAAIDDLRAAVGPRSETTNGAHLRLDAATRFIENHRHLLRYGALRDADMDIATGAVEGAINYVIGARLDGSMMRWCPRRAGFVLALRCVQYNGHWDAFTVAAEEARSRRRSPTVGRITPQHRQTPYDAVRKAA